MTVIVVALTTLALVGALVVVDTGLQQAIGWNSSAASQAPSSAAAQSATERLLTAVAKTETGLILVIVLAGFMLSASLVKTLDHLVFSRLERLRAEALHDGSLSSAFSQDGETQDRSHDELADYETALRRKTQELAWKSTVLDSVSDIVYVHDLEGHILYANRAASVVLGYPHEELLAMSVQDLVPSAISAGIPANIARIAEGGLTVFESTDRMASGEYIPVQVHSQPFQAEGRTYIVSVVRDLSGGAPRESTVAHLAFIDPLTNTANRRVFEDRVKAAITRAQRNETPFTVAFVDLDRLKAINDELGHSRGDDAIKGVANRLASLVRDSDTLARLGGDEFALLLGDADEDVAVGIAQRIVELAEEPLAIGGATRTVSLSIGMVAWSGEADAESLLRKADAAMYCAKRSQPGSFRVFEAAMLDDSAGPTPRC